jgi:hypothetical protein
MTKSENQRFVDKQAARQYARGISRTDLLSNLQGGSSQKRAEYNFLDFSSNSSIAGSLGR